MMLINCRQLNSPIITLVVGREQRLFAAHEDVLCRSPYFASCLKGKFLDSASKKVELLDEEPEVLSCVLEFLYKGDYYPRLLHDKRKNTWDLEDAQDLKSGGRGNAAASDRKSTRLNSSHSGESRMPSSA